MAYRKLCVFTLFVLLATQAIAMKRPLQEIANQNQPKRPKLNSEITRSEGVLENHYQKLQDQRLEDQIERQKNATIALNKAVKAHDFDAFARAIREADVNDGGNPVWSKLLFEGKKLRILNVSLFGTSQELNFKGTENNRLIKERFAKKMAKNDEKIKKLHQCVEMVVNNPDFDIQSTDNNGDSLLTQLIRRPFEMEYSPLMEEGLPSESTQPILAALLKKNGPCNQLDENYLAPIHYMSMMSMRSENAQDEFIDHLKSGKNALEAIETVITYGAKINDVTPEGNTPLHLAANDVTKVPLLLALGARFDAKNKAGETPADLSMNPRTVAMLNNPQEWIDDINSLVLQNSAQEVKEPSYFQFLNKRQVGRNFLHPIKNPCSYTQAVLQKTANISAEDMIREMGYIISDDNSEFSNLFGSEDSEFSGE